MEKINTSKFVNYTIDKLIFFKKKIKEVLNLILKRKEKIGVAPQSQKIPGGITKEEVCSLLEKMSIENNYKVRKLFNDCIEIEPS